MGIARTPITARHRAIGFFAPKMEVAYIDYPAREIPMSDMQPICGIKRAPDVQKQHFAFLDDLEDLPKHVDMPQPTLKRAKYYVRVRDLRSPGYFARLWTALKRIVKRYLHY